MTTHLLSQPAPTLLAPERASRTLANLTPNWFAAAMGTGIVANAAITLPTQVPGQRVFALTVWWLDVLVLAMLIAATIAHWVRHPHRARGHIHHPVMSHFYGAPPMAMLTVGAGALLVGRDAIGFPAALAADWVLWTAGTITGLASAVVVPYYAFTRHTYRPESASGGWLMPVVPPMVSASTGALLVPYLPAGQARESLLFGCYAMFGLTLTASLIVTTLIWNRLTQHTIGDAAAVPTLWIVLGFLGQSITAAGLLANAANTVLPPLYAHGAEALALFYGAATWGFAMLWLAIVTAITVRTLRAGMPFSLTWWSFTFPVGTVVTGTSGLAARTHLDLLAGAATLLYVFLAVAWGVVVTRTVRGVLDGRLLAG